MRRAIVAVVVGGLAAFPSLGLAGRLEVSVEKAGSPVGSALVRIYPGATSRRTLASGECAFAGLAAGTYRVVASKDISGVYNAAVNQAVTVPAHGTVTVTLRLTRAIMLNEYLPRAVGDKWYYNVVRDWPTHRETDHRSERVTGLRRVAGDMVAVVDIRWAHDHIVSLERSVAAGYGMYGEDRSGDEMRLDPPLLVENPLPRGQELHYETTAHHSSGAADEPVTLDIKLDGFDNITVPKGLFRDCARLVGTHIQGPRTSRFTIWAAEGVGIVKQIEQQGPKRVTRELAEAPPLRPVPLLRAPRGLIPGTPGRPE
ncbi:MAG: carboxypeptidase regulatory-like domain-containing protein [Armatimonadetes bacterium]|nr:carboxypeptidase regulatory-like domain-containing protein [Armatimonadota bacterium]